MKIMTIHGAWSLADKPQQTDNTNLWDGVGGRHDGISKKNPKQTPVKETASKIFIKVFKASKIKESFQT